MSASAHPTRRALASSDVRAFLATRLFGVMARRMLHAALVWNVYELTRNELWLGVLGLVEFLPVIPGALVGGAAADTRDRRSVMAGAQGASLLIAAGLAWETSGDSGTLPWLLLAALALRVAWSFEFPAAQAMLPALVPREIFQNSVVLSAAVRNLGFVAGPVLGGFLIEAGGTAAAYAAASGGFALSALSLLGIRRREARPAGTRMDFSAVREGVAFVRSRPAIWGAMGLDLLAVVFADPTVLIAVYAEEILAVGPRGYGILYASTAVGTLATTGLLLFRRPFARPGRALLAAVLGFGLACVVFGLSRSYALSIAALVASGVADQVSQVARSTVIQLSTPDALRGRVSSVNMIFIGASNEVGAAFTGFLAWATGAVFAVVAGGAACIVSLGWVTLRVPALRSWTPLDADQESGSPKRST